ncbi:VWA domain-containing protein [bacterium]|nr:VWA domain-containing protein [bacterium]
MWLKYVFVFFIIPILLFAFLNRGNAAYLPPLELNVEIYELVADTFPQISMIIHPFDEDSNCIDSLDESNYTIMENGVEAPSFEILGFEENDNKFDIVFAIDNSGSMGWYVMDLKTSMGRFLDNLDSYGLETRFGLLTFIDDIRFHGLDYGLGYNLTYDRELFLEMVDNIVCLGSSGDGPEVALDAICDALNMLVFRPEAKRIIIVVTDAVAHELGDGSSYSDVTLEGTVDSLLAYDAACYVIGADICAERQFRGPGSVTEESHGRWYNIDSFVDGFLFITNELYWISYCKCFLEYTTPEPLLDGALREVQLILEYAGLSDTAITEYYAPESLRVELIRPLSGSYSSNRSQSICIRCDYDMELIDGPSIRVRIRSTVFETSDTQLYFCADSLLFQPEFEYSDGESVVIIIENVEDMIGRDILLSPVEWYFKTDYSPPYLIETFPANRDSTVFVTPFLEIIFEDEMSGLNPSSIILSINTVNYDLTSPGMSLIGPDSLFFNCSEAGVSFAIGETVNVSLLRFCDSPDYGYPNCADSVEWHFYIVSYAVDDQSDLPLDFELGNAFPNPFNAATSISYALPERANVTLSIYDILGNRIRNLVDNTQKTGYYKVQWDGRNDNGSLCASGLYFYIVHAGGYSEIKACLMLK